MSDDFDAVPSRGARRDSATCLALVGVLLVAGGLLALAAMVLPQIRGVIFVGAGVLLFIGLHYITWGWWLSRAPHPDDDAERD